MLTTKYTTGRPGTKKTGPNDAGRVVWALGEFFFLYFVFLFDTNSYIIVPICFNCERDNGKADDEDDRPERRQTRRSGPR